jgi:hypothetical protein
MKPCAFRYSFRHSLPRGLPFTRLWGSSGAGPAVPQMRRVACGLLVVLRNDELSAVSKLIEGNDFDPVHSHPESLKSVALAAA